MIAHHQPTIHTHTITFLSHILLKIVVLLTIIAIHLVTVTVRLLVYDPDQRMTALKALNHTYLSYYFKGLSKGKVTELVISPEEFVYENKAPSIRDYRNEVIKESK